MAKIPFSKPALTYEEQLHQLAERGLIIGNKERASHLLESISYYRLSGYWYPLLEDKERHIFKAGSTFDSAFKMYSFDRALRVMIIRELEKIEVSIRSKMIYILSHEYDPFWYSNEKLFKDPGRHKKTLDKLMSEYVRSREEFIIKFKVKYNNEFPPCWILLEVSSFGMVSSLYSNLLDRLPKRKVSRHFGLAEKVLESWMHSIVYLRNLCAHHSRLWNNNLNITPMRPMRVDKTWLQNQEVQNSKSYYIISMLLYLLQTINPNNSFVSRFKMLLDEYPNIDVHAMGFPPNWQEEELWTPKQET